MLIRFDSSFCFSLGKRNDVVDFLDRDVSPIFQVHLAEGKLVDVLLVSVAATSSVRQSYGY